MRKHTLCVGMALLAMLNLSAGAAGPESIESAAPPEPASDTAVLSEGADGLSVSHSTSHVAVDSFLVAPEGYCINQENYYKLRDLAFLLTGKNTAFDVVWDDQYQCISMISGRDYTVAGGEMSAAGDTQIYKFVPSYSEVRLNGQVVEMTGYNINNNNYYRIRDVGPLIGFGVDWDNDTSTVIIDSKSGSEEPQAAAPSNEPTEETPDAGSDGILTGSDPESSSAGGTDGSGLPDSTANLPENLFGPSAVTNPSENTPAEETADPSGTNNGEADEPEVYPWIGPKIDGVLTILLDPGHGGTDNGCYNPVTNQNENITNLNVANYLKEMLEASGVRVIMTRTDTTTTLQGVDRKNYVRRICEQGELDLVFSIHHNGFNRSAHGSEVYVQAANISPEAGTEGKTDPCHVSQQLGARLLDSYMGMNLGLINRGVKETSSKYMVYTSGDYGIPAVLSEFCFIDHDSDVKLIDEPHEQQAEAKAMYDAIMSIYESTPY